MLYLSAVILAFFLAVVLITKKHKTHGDYILGAWLVVLGFHLLAFYLRFTNQYLTQPGLISMGLPLPLVHGPFLYLYTYQQTSSRPFNKLQLLHFIPVLLSYVSFMRFFLMPIDQQAEVWKMQGKGFETELMINLYAIYVSGVVYVALSLMRLLKYRRNMVHQFSNTEKINFNWLLYLILWIVIIWIVILVWREDYLIFGAASLFVIWLGYFGIKQVQVFTHPGHGRGTPTSPPSNHNAMKEQVDEVTSVVTEPTEQISHKYQKSSLSESDAVLIHERLKQYLAEQKPYTNPDLTLDELARELDVHPNHLSQVINSRENKNFYDLVNEKRVEAFIKSLAKPVSQQYTLLAIAYDCGFNSKASFNRNFKKYTGQTPSDYLKLQPAE